MRPAPGPGHEPSHPTTSIIRGLAFAAATVALAASSKNTPNNQVARCGDNGGSNGKSAAARSGCGEYPPSPWGPASVATGPDTWANDCVDGRPLTFGFDRTSDQAPWRDLDGIYIYLACIESFGLVPLADRLTLDYGTTASLVRGGEPPIHLPQKHHIQSWKDAGAGGRAAGSGFVWLPLEDGLRAALDGSEDIQSLNVHLRTRPMFDRRAGTRPVSISIRADEAPPARQEFTIDDARFFPPGLVADVAPPGRETEDPPAFFALHLTAPIAEESTPGKVITLVHPDSGRRVDVQWSVGPDRRAIFGSAVLTPGEWRLEFSPELVSAAGDMLTLPTGDIGLEDTPLSLAKAEKGNPDE